MKNKVLLTVIALLVMAAVAHAQSTAFTYQGRLADGGSPASDSDDLRFALYDALTLGTTQASIITNSARS